MWVVCQLWWFTTMLVWNCQQMLVWAPDLITSVVDMNFLNSGKQEWCFVLLLIYFNVIGVLNLRYPFQGRRVISTSINSYQSSVVTCQCSQCILLHWHQLSCGLDEEAEQLSAAINCNEQEVGLNSINILLLLFNKPINHPWNLSLSSIPTVMLVKHRKAHLQSITWGGYRGPNNHL